MILATKPNLKIIDKNKLYITRRPRLTSWLLLLLSVVVFFEIFRRLTDNVFFTIVSLTGEIMFGLDTLGEWEELILDKEQNRATITRCTWSDKLISGISKSDETFVKLTDIRHVGVSLGLGLFFVCRNGETIAFDTRGLTRDEIQNNRREINYFLNMNKMEYLNERRLDPYDKIVNTSDSEDENPRLSYSQNCRTNSLEDNESLNNIEICDDSLPKKKYLLQEALSTTSLERMQKNSVDYLQQLNLKRGRYTENSIVDRVSSSYSKRDFDRPGR